MVRAGSHLINLWPSEKTLSEVYGINTSLPAILLRILLNSQLSGGQTSDCNINPYLNLQLWVLPNRHSIHQPIIS